LKLYGDFTTQEEIDREYDIASALDLDQSIALCGVWPQQCATDTSFSELGGGT